MTIRFKLIIGFLILILIFIVDFFINQRLSREVIRNTVYINNSEAIIRNSNVLQRHMIDMQSGFRGYLLTGQESFLTPYDEGLKSIGPLVKEQRVLLNSDRQLRRLDTIVKLHQRWIDYADPLIATKRDTLPEANRRYAELFDKKLRNEVGKKLNDAIRQQFMAFDSQEYSVRQVRRENLQESIRRTGRFSLLLTLFFIALVLLSSLYIINMITRRINVMVNQAQEISKGNFITIADDKHDELNKLSDSLNTMSQTLSENFAELTRKNKELDQFAYVVSHDLKAPLRGIDNITSWIEEDHAQEISPAIRQNLDMIKGRSRRLENMINGLLDYARVGKQKRSHERVNVGELVRELVAELVPADVSVTINDMPVLVTDKLLLSQVFSNLLSNAVKYNNKSQRTIEVSSRELGSRYEFAVADNGNGIQSIYFDRIFTIFQTLQERDAFESTGVGLAIVKKIIEDQKTTVSVESEPGHGSVFRFTWPKYRTT